MRTCCVCWCKKILWAFLRKSSIWLLLPLTIVYLYLYNFRRHGNSGGEEQKVRRRRARRQHTQNFMRSMKMSPAPNLSLPSNFINSFENIKFYYVLYSRFTRTFPMKFVIFFIFVVVIKVSYGRGALSVSHFPADRGCVFFKFILFKWHRYS